MTAYEWLALPAQDYMNEAQRLFFHDLLSQQREDLQQRIGDEFAALRDQERPADEADLASREEQR